LEAALGCLGKATQAAVLIALSMGHASLSRILTSIAAIEVVVMLIAITAAVRAAGRRSRVGKQPPVWRHLALFTGVELIAFAYLRADALIVGRLLGPGPGATFGLAYRVLDAVTGLATPIILMLFPFAAGVVAAGRSLGPLRLATSQFVPRLACCLALAALLATVPLTALVPRLGEGGSALPVLLATVPLYLASAFELHLCSAEGGNAEIILLGLVVLGINVGLNLIAVPRFGLNGAAWVLVGSEAAQVMWLTWRRWQRTGGPANIGVDEVALPVAVIAVAVLLGHGATWIAAAVAILGLARAARGLVTDRSWRLVGA
jgi:O-antigen/teichoic acid export membrane protein